jgi:hypothetical protein
MSDETNNVIQRILRSIQHELADMRDDRMVMTAILTRLDSNITSLTVEMRALRSQFDRLRNDVRGDILNRIEALEQKV